MSQTKVHFMGIGGSGLSGVAVLAKAQGYQVSGCDLVEKTPYIEKLKKLKIPISVGHDASHLNNVDVLSVTPAAFFQNKNHPEFIRGKKEKKLMTWQEFLGKYLQKDKTVICIAGTHGKSTTTAMASLLFEEAKLEPWAMVGATLKKWQSNARVGKSKIFITESDEFYDNFLSYKPDVIVLNNIEFDHPDYFKNEKQMFESFRKFIENLQGMKVLIYNKDDSGIKKLLELIGKERLKNLNLYGYTTKGSKIVYRKNETEFEVDGDEFKLKIPGKYNVSNALGVIILGKLFKIPIAEIKKSLSEFEGIERRLELIGEKKNIKVYDDYAHHPTAIKATLEGLRQKYPQERIWAIVEPHTFSRTRALLKFYKNAFDEADKIIITPIFRSRDQEDFGISGESVVKVVRKKDIQYLDSFDKIVRLVKEGVRPKDIVIVMGAGQSYDLSRQILNSL